MAKTIRLLGLSEEDYADIVRETVELLDEPVMRSWIARTSLALEREGDLSGEEIEALRPSTPISERRSLACST